MGRAALPKSSLPVPFCPSDYAQFANGPHPGDERARSLMLARQSQPITFWETCKALENTSYSLVLSLSLDLTSSILLGSLRPASVVDQHSTAHIGPRRAVPS